MSQRHFTRPSRPRLPLRRVLLVGTIAVSLFSPTAAKAINAEVTAPSASADHVRMQMRSSVDEVRAAAATGRLGEIVRNAAMLADVPLPEQPAAGLGLTAPGDDLDTTVTQLLAAVEAGAASARAAVRGPAPDVDAEEALAALTSGDDWPPTTAAEIAVLQQRVADLQADADAHIDETALYAATLSIATAIDRALPALRTIGQATTSSAARVTGCDLIDEPPALCVGGAGSNTYEQDYTLLVDLGGDDVYLNEAATARGQVDGVFAAVVIDIAGNDRYEKHFGDTTDGDAAHPARSESSTTLGDDPDHPVPANPLAQGAGSDGGIGMLVDVTGNDAYAVHYRRPNSPEYADNSAGVRGQGAGLGGAGLLYDGAGDDRYVATNRTDGVAAVSAQGYGQVGGVGILVDGGGSDHHVLSSRPDAAADTAHGLRTGSVGTNGLGIGVLGGVGLFSGAHGDSTLTMRASAPTVDPRDDRFIPGARTGFVAMFPWAQAHAWGLGLGITGVGMALTGAGASTLTLDTRNETPKNWKTSSMGLGAGYIGGAGTFADAGGDDEYVVGAVSHRHHVMTIPADCECPARGAEAIDSEGSLGRTEIVTMGAGFAAGGVGLLLDSGGDDRYSATAHSTATATTDYAGEDGPGAPQATAEAGEIWNYAQGSADLASIGILEDLSGDDEYSATGATSAEAVVNSAVEAGRASAISKGSYVVAQGATGQLNQLQSAADPSYGQLRDLGGSDRYNADASSVAKARPSTLVLAADPFTLAQGSAQFMGQGLLADIDGLAGDAFSSSPLRPTCFGVRGGEIWQDCGSGRGGGVNR